MSGTLLAQPVVRAVDSAGLPMSGALLQFFLTGTSTPANVYTSSTLGTPLSNPVVADSGGLFVPIYLDPTVTYRCQLQTSGATVIRDIDPVSINVPEATLVQVNAGVATGTYVSPAKLNAWTGVPTALGYTPLNRAGDTATNLNLANSALTTVSAGYLGIPINEQDVSYTLVLTDAGKMVRHNSVTAHAYTVPLNASVAYPFGTTIVFRNIGTGVVTITRTGGVTIWQAGAGTNKDFALAQYGLATMTLESADQWVIGGVGLS